uniref:Bgt-135 n=1 Tax=Blumeria graminis f. sp. tritici 96224 TaxID=1268274 RepID=A0A381LAG1_BLUGR
MPSVASTRARRSRPGLAAPRRLPVFTVSKAGTTTSPSPRKRLSPSSIKIVSHRSPPRKRKFAHVEPSTPSPSCTELSSTQNSSPTGTVEASKDTACSLFHA